jgi:hypothetical protein
MKVDNEKLKYLKLSGNSKVNWQLKANIENIAKKMTIYVSNNGFVIMKISIEIKWDKHLDIVPQ